MTQVQQQIIKTRHNEQAAASVRADTDVLQAEFARKIQIVNAGAKANYTLQTKLAKAEAERRRLTAEAEALAYVRTKLGFSAEGAVQYTELSAYGTLVNATFLSDVPEAR